MRQAASLEAAKQWQQAAQMYGQAAKAFKANGRSKEYAAAEGKSAAMYENYANALLAGISKTTPAAPDGNPATETPAGTAAAAPEAAAPDQPAPAATMPAGTPPLPLEKSAIVHANKDGGLAVASATGAPIDGVKISTHDKDIESPSIVVTPDGVIHAAFFEQHAPGIDCDIYYRSSSDGGRTWSEAKNLSEVMPDRQVGMCRVAADHAGRVYVIWNVARGQYQQADIYPHANNYNNLVYRVLSGGQWSGQTIPIHEMATDNNPYIGSFSYFVATDPAGAVHVIWNEDPAITHPEVMASPTQASPFVGLGLVMEATLDGATPTPPQQVYLPPVTPATPVGDPPVCDGLDMLNGYVGAAGQPHFVSLVVPARGGEGNHFKIIESGVQTPGVDLPGSAGEYWSYPPTLLVDAQGHQHIITLYQSSEHPNVRDYTIGSDSEPKTIRAVKGTAGQLISMEAFQGPAGRMVALMDMNDTGNKTDLELYISMSSGGPWSAPVNVTNNTGRLAFHSTNTSSNSNVATMSWGYPGAAASTFDKSGHLLLLYVRNKTEIFGVNALGVPLAGGSTATPNLMFLRF